MSARFRFLVAATAVLFAPLAHPATLRKLEVTRDGERFLVVADTYLEAPVAAIFNVLVDYDDNRFGRISEIYKESGYLEPDTDGTPLVFTRVEGCLIMYCRSMRRVERIELIEPRFIRATTLPEQSDFKYAQAEFSLEAEGDGTKVSYTLSMEPDFWLPPFVGPWFLKRLLSRGGLDAVERIEELAVDDYQASKILTQASSVTSP
jgi:hypothetical protein